ncbi:MAG: uracil-DNA glycosylase, partial [Gammaproteobacteria bacterium]|nr:uracil-DNA glycosylase [Gammaproteobacteria bacterium]
LGELFANLERSGFLMLNATPVLHPQRKPALEARYWSRFLDCLLNRIAQNASRRITLVLWGQIAKLLATLPASAGYDQIICEHPYNLSFIGNPDMQRLLSTLRMLQQPGTPRSTV